MTWSRLSANAITNEAGHEIYRLPDGRFQVWSPPGQWSSLEQAVAESLARELKNLGFEADNPLEVMYRDARVCLGCYDTPEEARGACDTTT